MKPLFYIPVITLFLITTSCKKDTITTERPHCDTCHLTLTTLFVKDSIWQRQPDGTFTSDITSLIIQGGGTVSEVYSLEILSEGTLYQIYPNYQVHLFGGTLYGVVKTNYDNETCKIIYYNSNQDNYSGELPGGGILNLYSMELRIMLAK